MLLILAEPARPPQNLKWDERLVAAVDQVVAETLAEWGDIAGPGAPPKPDVDLGGPHMTALGDTSLIRYDMLVNIATSAVGVLLLVIVAFRRPGALAYALLPILCGLLLTFGFAELAVGSLSTATSVVAALLIGLGIDFAFVSYGRYIEERRKGESIETAFLAMSGSSARAVLVGAVTTTATFYAFTFTDFAAPVCASSESSPAPGFSSVPRRSSCSCPPCWRGARTTTNGAGPRPTSTSTASARAS
jgi:hypothetical protein